MEAEMSRTTKRGRAARIAVAAVAIAGAIVATQAGAQSRPDARNMSCGELQDLVSRSGQIVVTTGQFTYQRFVAHRGYCDFFETARQDYVETLDTGSCPISYICERRIELFGRN